MPGSLITDEIKALIGAESEPERNRFPISAEMGLRRRRRHRGLQPAVRRPRLRRAQPLRQPALPAAGRVEGHRAAHRLLRRRPGVALRGSAALQQLRPQRRQRLAVPGAGARRHVDHPPVPHAGHLREAGPLRARWSSSSARRSRPTSTIRRSAAPAGSASTAPCPPASSPPTSPRSPPTCPPWPWPRPIPR